MKYASAAKLRTTDAARHVFAAGLPRSFPISRPNTYPCTIDASITSRYRGSPQP
ncbi:MAG: hypothetical protein V8T01_02365 [Oscillospiraceae bacterium]